MRDRPHRPVLMGVLLLCAVAACGGYDNPAAPNHTTETGTPPPAPTFGRAGTFSMSVDGSPVTIKQMGIWFSNGFLSQPELSIGAASSLKNTDSFFAPGYRNFGLSVSARVGRHSVSSGGPSFAHVTYDTDSVSYKAHYGGIGSGTVTISSMTTSSAAGSFDVTVQATGPAPGASGSHRITGTFAVNFDCESNYCTFGDDLPEPP